MNSVTGFTQLKPKALLVDIQLDKVYVKAKMQYKGGKCIGEADNKEQEEANGS